MVSMPIAPGGLAVPVLKHKTVHTVTVSGTKADTGAFGNTTEVIRVVCDGACHIAFGEDATTDHEILPANVVEFIQVAPGSLLSAIQVSGGSGGTMTVTECD